MVRIVLTGFMGTGKTTIGKAVAQRLDCPFVDMDVEIARRAAKSIPRIFAEDGEASFRQIETALCEELSTQPGAVIATGGGTWVNPTNRAVMQRGGVVICLDADAGEILRRVGAGGGRPLLDVPDPAARVAELLNARNDAYAAIPWHVETTGHSVETIVARVLALSLARTLPVQHPGGSYDIHIGTGLLAHLGGALRAAGVSSGTAIAIVTNTVVGPLYGAQVEATLNASGYRPFVCTIADGEQHKTLATVRALYDEFLARHFDRSGTVLALGGGVTGDIAGFAAATFMRGARFVQVPTSLLAMTDASVGGKTGVDLPQGKNLVGAFKQPDMVLIDLNTLQSLPVAEFRSGMAELIKHGVIADVALFETLEHQLPDMAKCEAGKLHPEALSPFTLPPEALERSIRVKITIVEQDPFEKSRRAVLNLGHTSAHGLERVSDFSLRHGEAVSIGMVVAARIAQALGQAPPELAARVVALLAGWGLPVTCPPYSVDAIWEAMLHDKKKRGKTLRWILPRAIGDVDIVQDVPENVVKTILIEMGATSSV